MIVQYKTYFSTYEVDTEKKLVRRMEGVFSPTPRQGEDGEWKEYHWIGYPWDAGAPPAVALYTTSVKGNIIVWSVDEDTGAMYSTLTSDVQETKILER